MRPDPLTAEPADPAAPPLISLRDVSVRYALRGSSVGRLLGRATGWVTALDRVSLDIAAGEAVGLVGESGSGKTTLGRALLGLAPVSDGSITFDGREISRLRERQLRPLRAKIQMVFQDPAAALNPSMTVGTAVGDALRIQGVPEARRRPLIEAALDRVGLSPVARFATKYPSELSGGQKQRAVIARAICLDPQVLVADEPISMLDMSVRAKILQLLGDLRDELGISFVYITHDLASARFFCDRIAILYLGRIVEIGPTEQIFANPRHPYTQALLRAVPDVSHRRADRAELPRGEIADAARPPQGCAFHPRCPAAFDRCGWEARDLGSLLEQRWTSVDLATYREESALLPDVSTLAAEPDGDVVVRSRHPERLLQVVQEIRAERPDEPFFTGLRGLTAESAGLRMSFAPAAEPELLPVPDSSVQVACHLYH